MAIDIAWPCRFHVRGCSLNIPVHSYDFFTMIYFFRGEPRRLLAGGSSSRPSTGVMEISSF